MIVPIRGQHSPPADSSQTERQFHYRSREICGEIRGGLEETEIGFDAKQRRNVLLQYI